MTHVNKSPQFLCSTDKRQLLEAAKANAMKILGVEKLELPESVKPILSDPEPEKRVRQGSQQTGSQVSVRGKVTCMGDEAVKTPQRRSCNLTSP